MSDVELDLNFQIQNFQRVGLLISCLLAFSLSCKYPIILLCLSKASFSFKKFLHTIFAFLE